MIPVYWLSLHQDEGIIPRGYWDQAMLEDLFANELWDTGYTFEHHEVDDKQQPGVDGAILVVPARHHAKDIERIKAVIEPWDWCIIVLTGDEDNEFDYSELNHPNMKLWVMTPNPDQEYGSDTVFRFLGSGYTPYCRKYTGG